MLKHILTLSLTLTLGLLPTAFSAEAKTTFLTLPTATMSGTYYQYFSGVGQIFSKKYPDINITVTASSGALENVKLLEMGEAEIAPSSVPVARFAFDGTEDFSKPVPLRGVLVMFSSHYHFITLDKNIKSIDDLAGKTVSIGLGSSLMEKVGRRIFTEKGMLDKVKLQYLSIGESCSALKDGTIDAALLLSTLPLSPVMELCTSRDVNFVPVSEDIAKLVGEGIPSRSSVIPAGTYPGLTKDVPSITFYEGLFAHKDASPDMIYMFLKVLYENKEDLMAVFPGAKTTTPEMCMEGMAVPLHPGAYRYYKELGIEIPDALKPTE